MIWYVYDVYSGCIHEWAVLWQSCSCVCVWWRRIRSGHSHWWMDAERCSFLYFKLLFFFLKKKNYNLILFGTVGREHNLSETAFIWKKKDQGFIPFPSFISLSFIILYSPSLFYFFFFLIKEIYNLRWFTPSCEVDLCGHATLGKVTFFFLSSTPLSFRLSLSSSILVWKSASSFAMFSEGIVKGFSLFSYLIIYIKSWRNELFSHSIS